MRVVCAVVVALFVGKSWFADYGVLVEGDEVGVFENGEVCVWKGRQLYMVLDNLKDGEAGRENEGGHTSVPMIRGDFMIAHRAKWARFSSIVKSPLPTSSISGSLWPQKSTLDSS